MTAGLSFAEREAKRERMKAGAIESAIALGMTERCRYATAVDDLAEHQMCRGESPGGAGCLCRCHDNPGAVVVSRKDAAAGSGTP